MPDIIVRYYEFTSDMLVELQETFPLSFELMAKWAAKNKYYALSHLMVEEFLDYCDLHTTVLPAVQSSALVFEPTLVFFDEGYKKSRLQVQADRGLAYKNLMLYTFKTLETRLNKVSTTTEQAAV